MATIVIKQALSRTPARKKWAALVPGEEGVLLNGQVDLPLTI